MTSELQTAPARREPLSARPPSGLTGSGAPKAGADFRPAQSSEPGPADECRPLAPAASLEGGPLGLGGELASSAESLDAATGAGQKPAPVGPVKGIFFKVWSLVKVTKAGRHNQKLRRQNSETTQFQKFTSGDASGPGPAYARLCRRAGSQPPGQRAPVEGLARAAPFAPVSVRPSLVRRHISAYTMRRPEVAPAAHQRGAPSEDDHSWTARFRRSATSVNHTDWARRRLTSGRGGPPAPLQRPFAEPEVEAEADAEEEEEEDQQEQDGPEGPDEEEDIYSTPNDSIQSVPSGEPSGGSGLRAAAVAELAKRQINGVAVHQVTSQAYPIVKSFSTSSFGQLLRSGQPRRKVSQQAKRLQQPPPLPAPGATFKPIDESGGGGGGGGLGGRRFAAETAHFHSQDSKPEPAPAEGKQPGQVQPRASLSNGSRFFISSSSSSEDSSNAHPSSQRGPAGQPQPAPVPLGQRQSYQPRAGAGPAHPSQPSLAGLVLDQRQCPVSVCKGVHYHSAAAARRPESLQMGPPLDGARGRLAPTGSGAVASVSPQTSPHLSNPALLFQAAQAGASRRGSLAQVPFAGGYKKSPSLFEMSAGNGGGPPLPLRPSANAARFLSNGARGPPLPPTVPPGAPLAGSNFRAAEPVGGCSRRTSFAQQRLSNSVSLHDCKLPPAKHRNWAFQRRTSGEDGSGLPFEEAHCKEVSAAEYNLTQMLLKFGSDPNQKDENGYTALMHAVLGDNLAAVECLIENGAHLNETNGAAQLTALDLLVSRTPTTQRLRIFKLLADRGADLDRVCAEDGLRLLDRVIAQHQPPTNDKLPYIDRLLQYGAKLGSSTWQAASGKETVQLRLLRKLCQDGYFLYKQSSIEEAVYRFEYALRRIAELEQQVAEDYYAHYRFPSSLASFEQHPTLLAAKQIKYQTYLGLSRCERQRKFFKRALEFAHMAILVDSTSYEAYYSKAHILKNLGELNDSLQAIDQTARLVDKSIENAELQLRDLELQEEALILDNCFNLLERDSRKPPPHWIDETRTELNGRLEYLFEARRYVARLRDEIMVDKLNESLASEAVAGQRVGSDSKASINNAIAT